MVSCESSLAGVIYASSLWSIDGASRNSGRRAAVSKPWVKTLAPVLGLF